MRFIRNKDEVLKHFKEFVYFVENLKGKRIKYLQSDNGGEYVKKEFDLFLKERGIRRRLTVPHTPQQNGLAERMNRTLFDTARCLLFQAKLPPSFWAEAVNTACYIRNRCPSSSLKDRTPFESWFGNKPYIGNMKEFGSKVYLLNKTRGRGKLGRRALEGIFVGYASESKAFRIWVTVRRRVEISRNVKFFNDYTETESGNNQIEIDMFENPLSGNEHGQVENIRKEEQTQQEIEGNVPEGEGFEEKVVRRGPGRPKIWRTGKVGRPRKVFNCIPKEANLNERAFVSEIPLTLAMKSDEKSEWLNAMAEEIKSIIKNGTWQLERPPEDDLIVGSRIILTNKYNTDGTIERRKARLVAQGFSQKPGLHFSQTFAPVARMSSIRLAIALAVKYKMKITQFDVTTAYLNGKLDERIYMEPPKFLKEILTKIVMDDGCEERIRNEAEIMLRELTKDDGKKCRLIKSLYGLKQAGRSWYKKLSSVLIKLGATPSKADPCIYRYGQGEEFTIITTYVDDLLIMSANDDMIRKFSTGLAENFEMKDLGEVKTCLGIEFSRNENEIRISQGKYISDILNKFGMENANPVSTPLDLNVKLSKPKRGINSEELNLPYRELLGALTYLAVSTRPDISHAVSKLGQFNNCYDQSHWKAAKRVLRYLKGTINVGLVYSSGSDADINGYVDADWGNDVDDRRSFTGYCFFYGNGLISWESRKQRTVALSSNEAEYMGMSDAAKEAIYLRNFLVELQESRSIKSHLLCDNMGALKMSENPSFHARSKHIDLRHHFIRDAVTNRLFDVKHIITEEMIADILTKALPRSKHEHCMKMLKLNVW